MPPKKAAAAKTKKRKGGSGRQPVAIDGLPIGEMSREQVEDLVYRLKMELDREREERNYYQIERDKVQSFWDITKQELASTRAELRNKGREGENAEEVFGKELQEQKQRMHYLSFDQSRMLMEQRAAEVRKLKAEQDLRREKEGKLIAEIRLLKNQVEEKEAAYFSELRQQQLKHTNELTAVKKRFELEAQEIERRWIARFEELESESELEKQTELNQMEEKKNAQIQTLIEKHEKAFLDLKSYYNDITINNLALINTLKEQISDMKIKEEQMDKKVTRLQAENEKLAEPMRQAESQVADLRKMVSSLEREKGALKSAEEQVNALRRTVGQLKWQKDMLEERFSTLERERDDLHKRLVAVVSQVQQRSSFKNLLLERQVKTLGEDLEKREAQLNEVLTTSPGSRDITVRVEDIFDNKNSQIRDLKMQIARACKRYNEFLREVQTKGICLEKGELNPGHLGGEVDPGEP
ncbi:unnamed protein product [Cyprideis torosa]|uniref:Dynein regulatory complex subunit 4 n=1 Tax=Cyprideis torosa TaxID=163714 RepID=A0A7R8WJM6_9CRUS|nr:unnamed protein product [Cyprideis torosa]CAG0902169.1 unnamed protein product [Cyprideis torosa]